MREPRRHHELCIPCESFITDSWLNEEKRVIVHSLANSKFIREILPLNKHIGCILTQPAKVCRDRERWRKRSSLAIPLTISWDSWFIAWKGYWEKWSNYQRHRMLLIWEWALVLLTLRGQSLFFSWVESVSFPWCLSVGKKVSSQTTAEHQSTFSCIASWSLMFAFETYSTKRNEKSQFLEIW